MPKQKISTMAIYIYIFIVHYSIPNIIEGNNKTEFQDINYHFYFSR